VINSKSTLYLLAFPVGLMGIVQLFFSMLSLLVFDDHHETDFFIPGSAMLGTALILIMIAKHFDVSRMSYRNALLFAVLAWVIMGFLGAIPIVITTGVSITDGVFESISGLTTTGATILTGLDTMPRSFLLYRQFLQWLGGLGVVIFVVAILPMLNVGGMKLLKAETPGPIKDEKLSPRVAHTAHYLWYVYLAITLGCAAGYYLAGMNLYEAIAHSFTTVSTGGFSTYDGSMGHFDNPVILVVSDVFMLLGAFSFALHYRVWRRRSIFMYWRDEETRSFLWVVLALSLIITAVLLYSGAYSDGLQALNHSVFHLISFITSTGYGASNFTDWPYAVTFLLVFAGYLGGCAGSTAGGNKIIRNILSFKLIHLELKRLVHPKGIFFVKYQGKYVEENVLNATVSFMFIAALISVIVTLMLMMTGLDFWSALTATAACLNVLGPAFGELGSNFQPVSDVGTWILSGAMILGRLEYFTVLALILPSFWRR
jgi:trk system potassium uptake protein TrkH